MDGCWCVDTNVLISGLAFRGPEYRVMQSLAHATTVMLWFPLLEQEVTTVLARKFPHLAAQWPTVFRPEWRRLCPDPPDALIQDALRILRDPKDAPILAAAWAYQADRLITGDKDLLVLSPEVARLPIQTAAQTWAQIAASNPGS